MKLFFLILIFIISIPVTAQKTTKPDYEIIYQGKDGEGALSIQIYLKDFRTQRGQEIAKIIVNTFDTKKVGTFKFEFWEKKFSKSEMKQYVDEWKEPGKSRSFQINYYAYNKAGTSKWKVFPIQNY
jgi:hypothetical protein